MFTSKKPQTLTPSQAPTTPTRPIISKVSATSNNSKSEEKTIVSKGCVIKGDVAGDNDMNVFGKAEGTITLENNILTVEVPAQITASISAKVVHINGNVVGNIQASEKIIITDTGNVTGDMSAPKVILKDGSYFKGNVSMTDNKVDTIPKKKP